MKRVMIALACTACSLTPKYVTVPMATFAPTVPMMAMPGDEHPDDPDSSNEELSGVWNGRAWQAGKSWLMTLTFEKRGKSVVARSYYPDQRCRAEAVLQSSEPRHWAGDESVTVDPLNRCPNHGHIVIEVLDEDTLTWRWTGAGGIASSSLTRTQPRDE